MTEHEHDDMAQLREIDPGAGATASAELRERVEQIPGEGAVTDLATRRRAPRWLVPVAAAAAVAVGFGGGILIGTGGLGTAPAGPTIAVETSGSGDPAPAISFGSAPSGEKVAGGAAVDAQAGDSRLWWGGGNRRFIIPSFSGGPGVAPVYAVDGSTRFSAEDAADIATALGIAGAPLEQEWGGWSVGDAVAGAPALWLSPSGAGDVSYSTGIVDPWTQCWTAFGSDVFDDPAVAEAASIAVQACVDATPMPAEAAATDALRVFMSAIGTDAMESQIEVTVDEVGRTATAVATRIVDGNLTQLSTAATVSAAGVLNGYGQAGALVALGDYEILSADDAAARLNGSAFQPTMVSWGETGVVSDEVWEPATTPPAVPAAGSAVPWAIAEYEIVSARLGLATVYAPDDTRYLAPAYEFTDSAGNVWSVIAIAEGALVTSP